MLRVGLTGELGSGKSTVARMLAERGAVVLSSDEMARAMMQPGQPVYEGIVGLFGPDVLLADGRLDRRRLAEMAFTGANPRVRELNALVHPPVLAEQERRIGEIAREQPDAIVVVESALILTAQGAAGEEPWRQRFDLVGVVVASDEVKVSRYVGRMAGDRVLSRVEEAVFRADAIERLRFQRIGPELCEGCFVMENEGDLGALRASVDAFWMVLRGFLHGNHAF